MAVLKKYRAWVSTGSERPLTSQDSGEPHAGCRCRYRVYTQTPHMGITQV